MIKKLGHWLVTVIKETLNLSWTLVGLVIATLTLTGSAQQVTGLATVITLAIWLLTISFRKEINMDCCGKAVVEEVMKLQVVRTQFGKDATNGLLFIDGIFECYTLEDQYQAVKVMHETCIPEGTYDIKFRKTGGFHAKYSERYGKCTLWYVAHTRCT